LRLQLNDGEQLYARIFPGELRVDCVRELLGFGQVRLRRRAPQQISVWRVGRAACDRCFETVAYVEKSFAGAFASDKRFIRGIGVAGE
jgi:hypothetical protein